MARCGIVVEQNLCWHMPYAERLRKCRPGCGTPYFHSWLAALSSRTWRDLEKQKSDKTGTESLRAEATKSNELLSLKPYCKWFDCCRRFPEFAELASVARSKFCRCYDIHIIPHLCTVPQRKSGSRSTLCCFTCVQARFGNRRSPKDLQYITKWSSLRKGLKCVMRGSIHLNAFWRPKKDLCHCALFWQRNSNVIKRQDTTSTYNTITSRARLWN